MFIDFLFPFCACIDVSIAPDGDQALPLERHEVCPELLEEGLIFTGVAAENFYCRCHRHLPNLPRNSRIIMRSICQFMSHDK